MYIILTLTLFLGGIIQYPDADQTITALPLSPSLTVAYKTSPNHMANATDNGYETTCMEGYVNVQIRIYLYNLHPLILTPNPYPLASYPLPLAIQLCST
jgi:hypothetical protein